jgi:hypothetical protein
VLFLPLYSVFPDPRVGPVEALPGAVTAALGWTLLGAGFSVYVDLAVGVVLYGVLGGIFLLVTFLYFGALIVVAGAVINVTLGPDRQLQQDSSPGPGLTRMPGARDDDASREDLPRDDAESDGADHDGAASDPDAPHDHAEARDVGASDDVGGATDRGDADEPAEFDPGNRSPEEARLREEVADLRAELDEFRDDVEDRTVERDAVEGDLRRYVRRRVRRGHARGWGPYLVLLYGTGMTIGAFYYLSGGWAIAAMLVIWLSTLGLYTLMVLVGFGISILGLPGRLRDRIGDWRD